MVGRTTRKVSKNVRNKGKVHQSGKTRKKASLEKSNKLQSFQENESCQIRLKRQPIRGSVAKTLRADILGIPFA
jgi:hypothetical protein